MRRRNTATPISIVTPQPVDPEAEVSAALDARQKLQVAIATENQKHDSAEIDFARNITKEISNNKVVNVETVFQRSESAKTAAERAKQRLDALTNVLDKVNKRIEQLKAECSELVGKALSKRIEALEKLLADKDNAGTGIEDELKVLRAELSKLPKATPPKKGTDKPGNPSTE
jgi:chromosome segregation ATPase